MLTIKILGKGCPNCQKTEQHTHEALAWIKPPESTSPRNWTFDEASGAKLPKSPLEPEIPPGSGVPVPGGAGAQPARPLRTIR